MGRHAVTSSTLGRDGSDGDSWSRMEFGRKGADPSTGREETQERFSSIYPIPFPPAANEPPSQVAGEPSMGRCGQIIRNALRNGMLHSNLLAHIPKIIRTQLPQG